MNREFLIRKKLEQLALMHNSIFRKAGTIIVKLRVGINGNFKNLLFFHFLTVFVTPVLLPSFDLSISIKNYRLNIL